MSLSIPPRKEKATRDAILSKEQPLNVTYDIGVAEHDLEGRVITAEYPSFYFVTVYVPNSGRGLDRLVYRSRWDADFMAYIKSLEKLKPVVICGDLNVAHQPIDLARPKSNYNKTAGYTEQEIGGVDNLLNAGFVDTYRYLYPEKEPTAGGATCSMRGKTTWAGGSITSW